MDQSKVCGIAIGALGGWLLYGAWQTILIGVRADMSWPDILNAAFSLRFVAAMAAFVAGVAALTELKGGAWFAGIATFIMGTLTIGMIFMGVDKTDWQDQVIYLFILTALFLGILVARGQSRDGPSRAVTAELAEIAREEAAAKK